MNQFTGIKPSRGTVVFGSVVAFFLGIFQPFALIMQLILPMPGACVSMIAAAVLYAYAGVVPVVVLGIASVASTLLLGLPAVLCTALMLAAAVVMIFGMRRKQPFFAQMPKAVIVSAAMAVAAIGVLTLFYGTEMVAHGVNQLRATFESQKDIFYQMLAPMISGSHELLSLEEFVEVYYQMFNVLQVYYEYALVANLLTGAIASALLALLWGNWAMARRGEATVESFRGLGEWYLPANTTFGLLLMFAAGFVLQKIGMRGADSAWIVVRSLCGMAFIVQSMGAMDRRMKQNGSGRTRRVVMLVLLVFVGLFFGQMIIMSLFELLTILGCYSALFGRKGAAVPFINKIKAKMDGEDR